MQTLDNKVAFVTGGSRGIGAATVRALAHQGASVAFTFNSNETKANALVAELEENGLKALALQADNAENGAVTSAVEAAHAAYGALDIVVNNAGIFDVKPVLDFTMADYDRTANVNIRAVYEACLAAAHLMSDSGRIINIGSTLAVRAPFEGLTLYSLSKAALTGLTKALARDLGPRGITVNIVHPGSTNTDMNPADDEAAASQLDMMAIRRFGDPEDVAALIAWLASPEARAITGAEYTIDHGANA